MDATCPNCRAQLKNVQPNLIGRIRCSSCDQVFDAPGTVSAQAPSNTPGLDAPGKLPASPMRPQGTSTAPAPRPPLGKEPQPANYGLLVAVGYAALLLGLGVFGWQMYRTLQLTNQMGSLRGTGGGGILGMPSSTEGLARLALKGLLLPCAGLGILLMTGAVVRIDRRASWLAWRGGGLTQPVTQPQGSSLPFILPFCVSGGLLVIFGVQSLQPQAWAGGGMMPEGTMILAAGGVLFLAGLGCGELWRFFWRMGQLGKAVARRQRGDELGIGPVVRSAGIRAGPGHSSLLMRITVLALLIAYGCVAWLILEQVSTMNAAFANPMFSQASVQRPSMLPYYGNLLAGFIAVVGGAYTLFVLTKHWDEVVQQWRAVGGTTNNPLPILSESPTSVFRLLAWIVLLVLAIAGIRLASDIGKSEMRGAVLVVALAASSGLALCWLASLKSETLDMRRVTARAARSVKFEASAWIAPFSMLMGALALGMMGWDLYDLYRLMTGLGGRVQWEPLLYASAGLLAAAMPFVWLAMMVRDIEAIRSHLDAIAEK